MFSGRVPFADLGAGQPDDVIRKVVNLYPFKPSRFLLDRLREGNYSTKAARQYYPDARKLLDMADSGFDPCCENTYKATSHVIQKYENRAAFIITQRCFVYCRFCFRRDFVGFPEHEVTDEHLDQGLRYLRENPENRDVLLTGGDPLTLPKELIDTILEIVAMLAIGLTFARSCFALLKRGD